MSNPTLKRNVRRALRASAGGLGVLALIGSAQGNVGGSAYSTIDISNLTFEDAATDAPLTLANFESLDAGDTTTATANTSGFDSVSDSERRNLDEGGFDQPNADLPTQCVGTDCGSIDPNDWDRQDLSGDGSPGHFARGDALLEGSFVDTGDDDIEEGTTATQVSESQLDRTGSAETSSEIFNNSEFTFVPEEDFNDGLNFSFLASAEMYVELFQDETNVDAAFNHQINLRDAEGERLFKFAPEELGDSVTRFSEGSLNVTVEEQLFEDTTPQLFGGEQYSLSINTTTSADAQVQVDVPEPASIAMLGTGLVLLGGTLAWRRGSQNRLSET